MPEEVKQRRLAELIAAYRQELYRRAAAELGRRHLVLVEGPSRRSGARAGLVGGCGWPAVVGREAGQGITQPDSALLGQSIAHPVVAKTCCPCLLLLQSRP